MESLKPISNTTSNISLSIQNSNQNESIENKKTNEMSKVNANFKELSSENLKQIEDNSKGVKNKFEVELSQINFGYNDKTKDLFIKVSKGGVDRQYPTEEILRIKEFVINMNNKKGSVNVE